MPPESPQSFVAAVALASAMVPVASVAAPSKVVPFAEVKWEAYAPGVPLQVAVLWGDRTKGAYGMYLKMPGGFEAGMHAHTADYHGVLVTGTWQHWDEGGKEGAELGPGSYVMQPGKSNHNDKCKA